MSNADDIRRLIAVFRELQQTIAGMQAGLSLAIVELGIILKDAEDEE